LKVRTTILLLLLLSQYALAQNLEKVSSFKIGFAPTTASVDRQGYLYFSNDQGVIDKFDKDGKVVYHFSPQKQGTPTLIDA